MATPAKKATKKAASYVARRMVSYRTPDGEVHLQAGDKIPSAVSDDAIRVWRKHGDIEEA